MAILRTQRAATVGFLFALLLLVAANAQLLYAWAKLWAVGGHDYGFVVLVASLWLLWRCRPELRELTFAPDLRGFLLLAPLGIGMWLTYLVDVRLAQMILFIASTGALVWALLGQAALRTVAGPITFLMLALPVWNYFRPVLQEMTVRATAIALQLTGIPTFVDETYIQIPRGAILVLSECSGAQYFQAGVTIGAFYAYLNFRLFRTRALVLAGFTLMAIAGNWIRVYALVFLGKLTEFQHFLVGWGTFTLLLALMFWLSLKLHRFDEGGDGRNDNPAPDDAPSAGTAIAATFVAALLLVAGPMAAHWTSASAAPVPPASGAIPAHAPWSGPYATQLDWRPSFTGTQAESLQTYKLGEREVAAYRGYYPAQNQTAEVINESNKVYTPPWSPRGGYAGTDYSQVRITAQTGGAPLDIVETRLWTSTGDAQRVVWHWYRIAGRNVVKPWQAKLVELQGLMGGRHDAVAMVLSTDARDLAAARELLREFVVAHAAELNTAAAD